MGDVTGPGPNRQSEEDARLWEAVRAHDEKLPSNSRWRVEEHLRRRLNGLPFLMADQKRDFETEPEGDPWTRRRRQ